MDTNYFRDWKTLGKRRSENQIIGESGIDILRRLRSVRMRKVSSLP